MLECGTGIRLESKRQVSRIRCESISMEILQNQLLKFVRYATLGICIARTRNLLDPSSWRGWDGKGYSTTFVSPYSLDPEAPKESHICSVIENIPTLCAALSMVWSVHLEKFVMTIGCFDELSKSFYISTSEDLIDWTPMRPFFDADMVPPTVKKMITSISYPALIDPLAPSFGDRNYYTIGKEPYLFWVSLGHCKYLWCHGPYLLD